MARYFISGGAGFIGSHIVKRILQEEPYSSVVVYDNFSSGRIEFLDEVKENRNLPIVKRDVKDFEALVRAMEGAEVVYHLASNPDIAKAMAQPDIDFWEGTLLTSNILEAARKNGVKKLIYTSGSGVYGDGGARRITEDYAPMLPISTYGASKLSGEALICAYCHMFDMHAASFRFANVVGPHQTHGVGYDFIKKLRNDPNTLHILGNGKQSKSYLHVSDAVGAMWLVEKKHLRGFSYYNVATRDYITVKQIADITVEIMGLSKVAYEYTGGAKGWKGDVPIVRLDSQKIRKLGWKNKYTSKEAVYDSIKSMCKQL